MASCAQTPAVQTCCRLPRGLGSHALRSSAALRPTGPAGKTGSAPVCGDRRTLVTQRWRAERTASAAS